MCFICKYCGKKIGNKGALVGHENVCKLNPNKISYPNRKGNGGKSANHIASNQYIKAKNEGREIHISDETRFKIGIGWRNKHLTNEMKEKISNSRKKWLSEHKDQHVWKRNSKFLSIPCENLKQYLKDKGINFVEEYEPFNDINYCLDIAWPDEKIAIEVNGNQHYNKDGSLNKYYQKRHNLFVERGWKIFEIHYTKCYNININDFNDILELPIYDKEYVGKYFSKKEIKKQIKEQENLIKQNLKQQEYNKRKQIIENLINNSGIDFTKSHWSTDAYNYLLNRNELFNKGIFRIIKYYCPEFLQREDVWKRKGSNI